MFHLTHAPLPEWSAIARTVNRVKMMKGDFGFHVPLGRSMLLRSSGRE
jgi:hypothetical protein